MENIEIRKKNIGVSLVKILAIFLVVLCHFVQTTRNDPNIFIELTDTLNNYRENIFIVDKFILYFFRCFGHLGNIIFIICSVWFLSDSNKTSTKKVTKMFLDVFFISVIILTAYSIEYKNLPTEYIVKSLLPNSYANNWYITGYMIMYSIHSVLNFGLDKLSKKSHFKLALASFGIYYLFDAFIGEDLYYLDHLTNMIVLYIIVNYIKKYLMDYCNNTKKQFVLLFSSSLCLGILYVIKFFFIDFKTELYMLNNPFLFTIGLALFNIFRRINIKNERVCKTIEKISEPTMYVYLIHENILFRNLSRVKIVYWMFSKLGLNCITIKVIGVALAIYIVSLLLSYIYEATISKVTNKLSEYLLTLFDKITNALI